MSKTVIIQDKGDYYSHLTQEKITEKVVDKNVIIAIEMNENDFSETFGVDVDEFVLRKESRHFIKTDKGTLFFDEKTGDKILLK